ncbi:hypothetical protein J5N97_011515 [Dioscorea zingiberensis]|uniref:Uncharacterized protein n=1 Tax=Dioscorea zingiberensis TaxID=325984 RepID=A0A9D5D382_9LILI|nr:hypothetical protein J5N97_011515 [Dioscorea zingiberensis]
MHPRPSSSLNDGFKCPNPTKKGKPLQACEFRKPTGDNFLQAQVTMWTMIAPLLVDWITGTTSTWEWKQETEFIYSMRRRIHTHSKKDFSDCIYGAQGQFTTPEISTSLRLVMNCEKRPIIADPPAGSIGELMTRSESFHFAAKSGTLYSPTMNATKSHAIFQLQSLQDASGPPTAQRCSLPRAGERSTASLDPEYKCGGLRR